MTMNFTDDSSASRSMPFEIEPITSAPSSADHTVPRPPNRLVPAITGPAIASSSRSLPPEPWLTANSREACMIRRSPPSSRRSRTRSRGRVHVDAGAPGGLGVATQGEDVPAELVRRARYSIPATKPTRISTASGTPRSESRIATAAITAAATTTIG